MEPEKLKGEGLSDCIAVYTDEIWRGSKLVIAKSTLVLEIHFKDFKWKGFTGF